MRGFALTTQPYVQSVRRTIAAALLVALPAIAEAGPPLICHPFHTTEGAQLLPWGTGSSWNDPDPRYDVRRLATDVLKLLTPDAPVLARMENMRRAAIYAAQDRRAADELLQALLARASTSPAANAMFDAGYLVESYKQAAHLHKGPPPTQDGYGMVLRAISARRGNAEMEFAASLMTRGATADAHLRRAKAAAAAEPLLARNIETHWR